MKENKQVNPAVSSCTAEIVQKDGLAKISRSPGIDTDAIPRKTLYSLIEIVIKEERANATNC